MAAIDAGADFLVLCDTNGGTLPDESGIRHPIGQRTAGKAMPRTVAGT
jgi:hypothetical protein